jgi:DNA-binding PadR family transcriptional regulator
MLGFPGFFRSRLRFLVLLLLSESPKKGIELIDEISKMTWGWWRPSPGSIYPLLSTLEREGLVKRLDDGRYQITQKGLDEIREYLPFRYRRSTEAYIEELESIVALLEDLGKDKVSEYKDRLVKVKEKLERLVS